MGGGWVPDGWLIDQDMLIDAGSRLQKIKMWPYFDISHYLLTAVAVREDLGPNAILFARQHPFSCWLSTMLMSFAGTFLANFLLGEPPIAPFQNHFDIMAATAVWYLVFYSPFDLVYKIINIFPIKIGLCVVKEVQRAHKISHGVAFARKLYPESYLVQVLVGISKGAGGGIVKVFEQLVRGVWVPHGHEILRPSFTTKACVIASIVFAVERNTTLFSAPHDLIYLSIVGFFVYFKLSALLLDVKDPLAPFENLFCALFMGGIWDAFSRAVDATKEDVKGTRKVTNDEEFLNKMNKSKKETRKGK